MKKRWKISMVWFLIMTMFIGVLQPATAAAAGVQVISEEISESVSVEESFDQSGVSEEGTVEEQEITEQVSVGEAGISEQEAAEKAEASEQPSGEETKSSEQETNPTEVPDDQETEPSESTSPSESEDPTEPDPVTFLDTPSVSTANVEKAVRISWKKVENAQEYRVYRKTSKGEWEHIATVSDAAKYEDSSDLVSGNQYFYTVRACAGDVISDWDETGSEIIYLPSPDLTVSNTSDGIKISWNEITGADSYYVYRKTDDNTWKRIKTVKDALNYTDTSVSNGTIHTYTVRGNKDSFYGGYSLEGITYQFLSVPEVKVSCNAGKVTVKWNEIAKAVNYYVYRKEAGGKWAKMAAVKSGTLSWKDDLTGEKAGISYYYTVRANSKQGRSSYKKSSAIRYLKTPDFSLSSSGSSIKMTWDAVKGASKYYVYRQNDSGNWKRIAALGSDERSYVDKNRTTGKKYTYTLRAVYGNSLGGYKKNGKSCTCLAKPVLSSATVNGNGNKVAWKQVTGATSYYIYRKNAGDSKWKRIDSVSKGSTVTYQDNDVTKGKSYVYTVRALASNSKSSYDARGLYCVYSQDVSYTYAAKIVNSVITSSMNNEQRLKACYNWYKNNTGYKRDVEDPLTLSGTSWIPRYAKDLFTTGQGNCYRHACSFAYVAATLGYSPKIVVGLVGSNQAKHGWVEITIDGTAYVFDEELQFSWERRGQNYNMFKQTYSSYPFKLVPKERFTIPVS